MLSVIIPVYNTEKYIEKCLVLALKNLPDKSEIILINDGSPDNSDKIINKFLSDKRIKYYKKENTGLSDTKNFGLNHANGKYIIYLDSDDFISDGMYEECLKIATLNDADIVYTDVMIVYDDPTKNQYWRCSTESDLGLMKHLNNMLMASSWNKMIKKELYDGVSFPIHLNNEDVAVTPILFAKAKKIIKVNKPYYNYYQRAGSIQNSKFSKKRFAIFDTSLILFERLKNFDPITIEQIKGCVYMHQIFDMYFYIIKNLPIMERIKYTKYFLKKINIFDDYYKNYYLLKYFSKLGVSKTMDFFRRKKFFRLFIYFLKHDINC